MSRALSNDNQMRAKDPSHGALAARDFSGLADAAARVHGTRRVRSMSDEHFRRRSRSHIAPRPRGRCLDSVRAVRTASLRCRRSVDVCSDGERIYLAKDTFAGMLPVSPSRSEMKDS